MKVVFLGPPGAGKGTQVEIISSRYNIPKIVMGDILRSEVNRGTELGKIVRQYMEKGELVPDEIILQIIEKHIKGLDSFILDGFPRTLNQAKGLEKITEIDRVVYIDVPDEEVKRRLLARGRMDDKPEVIENRLRVYKEQTQPLIDYYESKGILVRVDGVGSVEEVTGRIERALGLKG